MLKIHRVNRGDDFFIKLPLVVDGRRTPIDGWKFWMTVKRNQADADADAIFQLSTDAGSIVPYDAYSACVVGRPAHTKSKDIARYFGDFQGQSPAGQIGTLESFLFYIDPEITIAPSS